MRAGDVVCVVDNMSVVEKWGVDDAWVEDAMCRS